MPRSPTKTRWGADLNPTNAWSEAASYGPVVALVRDELRGAAPKPKWRSFGSPADAAAAQSARVREALTAFDADAALESKLDYARDPRVGA